MKKTLTLAALCLLLPCVGVSGQKTPEPEKTPAPVSVEPLVTEGLVEAPVADVWRIFSTAEGYTKLGVAKATVDFRPGGLIVTVYDPSQALDGEAGIRSEILAYEPLRMVATRIQRPPKGFPFKDAWKSVWTVVSLTDLGDKRTNVRVAMIGWGSDSDSQAMREFFRAGNEWVMKRLHAAFAP